MNEAQRQEAAERLFVAAATLEGLRAVLDDVLAFHRRELLDKFQQRMEDAENLLRVLEGERREASRMARPVDIVRAMRAEDDE